MSGPRASGSQTCKPSFALLRHEVAPRADKSIRVHERHDNRQERSPPDAFPLVARTSDPRPLGYEPTSRRLQSPRTSQTRRSRLIARPSHRTASHRIAAVTQRFVPKSVHKTARSTCTPRREISSALLVAYAVALRREGRYREADELLGQASQSDPFDADIELTHCRYSWISSFSWPMRLAIISLLCRPWRSVRSASLPKTWSTQAVDIVAVWCHRADVQRTVC